MVVAEPANNASIKFVCSTCWLVFDHGGTRACAGCGIAAPDTGWPTLPYKFRDRYLFGEKLGSGGQGVVFKAYDQQATSATWVAVKVAPPRDEASKEMFRREGRAAAMLSEHPQYFVGFRGSDFNDPAYLVLDYVPWPTLKVLRATEGNLPPLDVACLGVEILRGVRCMERRAMVHRDLKPENIFAHRDDDGSFQVKIADLGVWVDAGASDESLLGQLDEKRLIFGTPRYMSPEQLRGDALTVASDVYAVALVLWLLATGALPFSIHPNAGWEADRLRQCKIQPPRPVMMPEELYLILTTALRFNPEDRLFLDPQTLAGGENPASASAARGMEKALRRFIDDYGERRKRSLMEKAAKIQALDALLANGERRIATAQKLSAKADDFRARLGRLNGESTGFELVLDALRTIENQIEAWNVAVEDFVDAKRDENVAAIERALKAEEREAALRERLAAETRQAAAALEEARAARGENGKRTPQQAHTRPSVQLVGAVLLTLIGLSGGYALASTLGHTAAVHHELSTLPAQSSAPAAKAGSPSGPEPAPPPSTAAVAAPSEDSTPASMAERQDAPRTEVTARPSSTATAPPTTTGAATVPSTSKPTATAAKGTASPASTASPYAAAPPSAPATTSTPPSKKTSTPASTNRAPVTNLDL